MIAQAHAADVVEGETGLEAAKGDVPEKPAGPGFGAGASVEW